MRSARMIATLSEQEKHWLERYSKVAGISIAEAIRRGVKGLIEKEGSSAYKGALMSTQGIWTRGDGLEYQENLREEWH